MTTAMTPIGLPNRSPGQMTGTASQTPGRLLYQQASQSAQPEVLVKGQFQKSAPDQRSKLADQFINAAGRDGLKDLSATPDGQHLLAVVYDHAGEDSRQLMRQVHEEQGNTAVDYTGKQTRSDSGNYADDPLNVSDAGVEIGPRISVTDYTAMTSGVVYGLVENTVKGIAHMGAVVGKESQELKNVDNLEYTDIDEYGQDSGSPGLTIPSMEEVGNALKGHIEATNKALKTAKDAGDYFGVGKAISNDPMLQMTGLGEMAIFGSLAKMRIATKLDSFTKNDGKLSGTNGSAGSAVEGKAGRPESAEQIVDVTNGPTMQGEVDAPNTVRAASGPVETTFIKVDGGAVVAAKQGNSLTFVNDLDSFRLSSEVGNTPNRLDIVTHGSPGSVIVGGESVSGSQLADALIRCGQLDGFNQIKLFSCSTGCNVSGVDNVAQTIANKTKLPVSAPNRDLITVPGSNKIFIADDLKFDSELNQWMPVNEGSFIDYLPK